MEKIHIGIHFGNIKNTLLLDNLLKSIFKYNTRNSIFITVYDSSQDKAVNDWLKNIEKQKKYLSFRDNSFIENYFISDFFYKKIVSENYEHFFVPYMNSFIKHMCNSKFEYDYYFFLPEDCQLIYDLLYLDDIINYLKNHLNNQAIISMLNLPNYRYKKQNNICNKVIKVTDEIYLHKCKFRKGDLFSLVSKELLKKIGTFNPPENKSDQAHFVAEQYKAKCNEFKIDRYFLNLSPFVLMENKRHNYYLKIIKQNININIRNPIFEKFLKKNIKKNKLSEEQVNLSSKWKYKYILNKLNLL